MINEMFLEKIIRKEFGSLTVDELKVIANNVEVFSLNKTNTKILEKIIPMHVSKYDYEQTVTELIYNLFKGRLTDQDSIACLHEKTKLKKSVAYTDCISIIVTDSVTCRNIKNRITQGFIIF